MCLKADTKQNNGNFFFLKHPTAEQIIRRKKTFLSTEKADFNDTKKHSAERYYKVSRKLYFVNIFI